MNPDELLDQLDEEQKIAAQALRGPTCILAGAGTGKTRTITTRIAYGIATGYYSANRVLALTYTNKAAAELRTRLRALGVGQVAAKTFHSAALSQLDYFWPQFAGSATPRVLDSKAQILTKLAQERKIKIDPAGLRDLAAEIEWRKYSMLSPEQYLEAKRNPPSGLTRTQTADLMNAYEDAKVAANQIDWEDVLVLCLGLLRAEPRALAHVQQQYRFFTVDEYQDISPLQHALLLTWLGDRNDICVVGDPNQTIYSFTGASSSYLQSFETEFENATVANLTSNYRSTQQIVTFANRLTHESALDALVSQQEVGMAPRVMEFANSQEEAAYIANAIRQALSSGVKASDIAVLYRVNGQSEQLENALTQAGIEYQLKGGERFFQRKEIQDAMRAIRAEIATKVEKPARQAMVEIARSLGWQLQAPSESGSARDRWESLNSLLAISDELPDGIDLPNLYAELDERQRSQHEPVKAAVTLATIHAAKGLEWQQVFIYGLTDGYLPISYAKSEAEIAEEKRLLYVGITRARKTLLLSHSKDREPSRFLKLLERKL
ncbi:MAG: hypothetical protein RL556_609 [Actinomycetota bacterium]|jgi:DNA helicase-2/ATP-dependent DNA helicase PcrA